MKSEYARELERRRPREGTGRRRWLFVAYDQLSDQIGPLAREDPRELGIVVVEAPWKAARRPYHKQKLALVLANLRHFSLEQAERGVAVRQVVSPRLYRDALASLARELGPLRALEPAERELRVDLAPLVEAGAVVLEPHDGWLTTPEQFRAGAGDHPPWRMDAFYRHVRRATGTLMERGKPRGGKWSFDTENRRAWSGSPPAPSPPRFHVDAITAEVGELIDERFADHPGQLDLEALPATRDDARALWEWAKRECLPHFGPFEDAMALRSAGLFHTRLAPLLNLHRLLPRTVVAEAIGLDLPLASLEGFVRQILGWREFVRHVHRETDGFRRLPAGRVRVAAEPGDGGYSRWAQRAWPRDQAPTAEPDGGACPDELQATDPLPPAFWGRPSGLACLDTVVREVWANAWSHHITRLMILSNLATLLSVSPRELTDWFWVAYSDAYDWVVEPNVLAMGTYATGAVMTTKPYVSGAAYIDRMSDYCDGCRFDPKRACPITRLYWAFLARNADRLKDNPRLFMPYRSLAKRSAAERDRDRRTHELVRQSLAAGVTVTPESLQPPGEKSAGSRAPRRRRGQG